MYFDAVLDENMNVLFNGTPDETKKWLEENEVDDNTVRVCIGTSMAIVTTLEYKRR
jgi:hypothetical protein